MAQKLHGHFGGGGLVSSSSRTEPLLQNIMIRYENNSNKASVLFVKNAMQNVHL